ncbi:hypothetical protein HQ45_07465 [Porphyromonas crevioricanis]|uniref:Fimbrillin-A associated anchor proteins Mfa1 and Mfa2 n=2 Tax=Porphyromonas crevioricanis TaxID=393921 RepID=A0A0A2FEI2_9PORP|nr:hypothetical protein HQ45_07465 [Porphyromonas crevioricanis]SJZ87595.1 Fimbrillin-A associated anchor protein Mfa1 and Mfa2 [Porphyromonas crevioricanis]SQH73152.1 Fimbrillin-A associated anchor proteins Mfa1 and Mfa2 [Porphyromonas crevioricanis]
MTDAKKLIMPILFFLISGCFIGCCIEEDLSDCPRPFQLYIRALDIDERDITESGDVQRVVLFVFDESGKLVERIERSGEEIAARTPVYIRYFGPKKLTFVAWANPNDRMWSQTNDVKSIADISFQLASEGGMAETAPDLLSGSLETEVEYGDVEETEGKTLDIRRRTAQVHVLIRGYERWLAGKTTAPDPATTGPVIGETPDTYKLVSDLMGKLVKYKLPGNVDSNGNFETPIVGIYPTAENKLLNLDLMVNGNKERTFSKGSDGKEFLPEVGRLLNIIIDLRANISVEVVVTPWNEVYQFVEY